MNGGRQFNLRVYHQLKSSVLGLLSDRPMKSRELQDAINESRSKSNFCNINQIVAALTELEREGVVFSKGVRNVMLWQKTPAEVVEKRRLADGAIKVSWMQDRTGR